MIDTVCLLISKDKIRTIDPSQEGVPQWSLHSKTDNYDKFVKNPSKRNLDSGMYFPRLTGYKRKRFSVEESVRIEFSASKLLYLNNLDEPEDKDFPEVIDTLQERLATMGIAVTKDVLRNASISSVHFSKNIVLEDGYTANHLISEMNKVNLRKSFDFARSRYINDGQSLYAHTTSHQLVVYDKMADLGKDKKRAIDKDQTAYQLNLFAKLTKEKELTEVLRFEIRLNQKQKLNKVLEQHGYNKNPTFKDIFKKDLSKRIVSDYWKTLIKERNLGLFLISLSLKDVLRSLYLANKKIKPKQAIYLLGLFMLAKDENGMRELRTIVARNPPYRTWYRIVKDMAFTSEILSKNRVRDWVTQIGKKLEEYKPIKQADYISTSDLPM
jgi:hypothetical protein